MTMRSSDLCGWFEGCPALGGRILFLAGLDLGWVGLKKPVCER